MSLPPRSDATDDSHVSLSLLILKERKVVGYRFTFKTANYLLEI